MINVFKKIWDFARNEQANIKKSIGIGFLNAIFNIFQLYAIFVVMGDLVNNIASKKTALIAIVFMLISIIGKIITQYYSQLQRVHAGYFMAADKRIQIGDKLKIVPMGYFNKNSLGNITAVSTTILSDVETTAPVVLVTTMGGFINALIFDIVLLIFDWRIGIIAVIGMILFLLITSLMEKNTRQNAPLRQKAQETLISEILETIQGMSVVKAFNLSRDKDKKVDKAINNSCKENFNMEKSMSPYLLTQQVILDLFSIGIIASSIYFYLKGSMPLENCLMLIVASFMIFGELKTAGSGMATLRLAETSIDRANELDNVPIMSEGDINKKAKSFDIEFKDVNFSYEKRKVLKGVSFKIPAQTMTAIIGPSGSGKTTICNLIARFWDVNTGKVNIGGINVKEYSLSELMSNISMVFQNVYLFADTIENNIKFGKPNATHEEVVQAAKKACCDDFILKLPDGYNTLIGEGGASLSGGEKQRISIARAMLKDAPIVIFDEATANIDPENEDRLQMAIEELTRNKTIIMIAHRLKTVRNAEQILVINNGKITQKGTHDYLIKQKGIYADFINGRKNAIGWKLSTNKR